MTAGPLVRGVLSALVAVVAVAAVGLGVFAWDRLAGGGHPTIPVATAAPRAPTDCARAQPNQFAALSAHLVPGTEFGSAQYAVDGGGGLTYLTAPVADGAGRVRAAEPVWVYGGSGYAWLNESARRLSSGLPDARVRYGVDPAGPAATRAAACASGR